MHQANLYSVLSEFVFANLHDVPKEHRGLYDIRVESSGSDVSEYKGGHVKVMILKLVDSHILVNTYNCVCHMEIVNHDLKSNEIGGVVSRLADYFKAWQQ
jgi:hypothetical protein